MSAAEPIEPLDCALERLVLPLPGRIPGAMQEFRLHHCPCQSLPGIVRGARRDPEAAAAAHVVRYDPVDRHALLHRPALIDPHWPARIELPAEITPPELRIGAAIAQPAPEDLRRPVELGAVPEVRSD